MKRLGQFPEMKDNRVIFFLLLFLIGIFCLALSVCAEKYFVFTSEKKPLSIVFDSYAAESYVEIAASKFPDLEVRRVKRNQFLRYLDEGEAPLVEISEWKAEPLLAVGKITAFYPHYADSIVIAVDRSVLKQEIRGWKDLLSGDFPVLMTPKEEGLFAIAAGLDPDFRNFLISEEKKKALPQIPATLDFLKQLERRGRLVVTEEDRAAMDFTGVPVMILPQSQAKELQRQGRQFEIVVPREGSLAMWRGLALQAPRKEASRYRKIDRRLDEVSDEIREEIAFLSQSSSEEKAEKMYFIQDIKGYNRIANRLYREYDRVVHQKKSYSSILHLNRIMDYVLLLLSVSLWVGWMQMRIAEDEVRAFLRLIFYCILLWLLIRILRHLGIVQERTHIFWYAYYVPFISIVTLWLILCGELTGSLRLRKYKKGILSAAVTAMLLILTNDCHSLIFRFENPDRIGPYHYGLLYHLITGMMILMAAGAMILLFSGRKNRINRRRIWAPVAVGVSILLYHALYILRWQPIYHTDMTMSYILFICLFIESMLYIGAINTNTTYRDFFVNNPQKIYLLSKERKIMIKTEAAEMLSDDFIKLLFADRANINRYLSETEGKQYKIDRIRGGYVLWEEDMQILLAMKEQLEENSRQLLRKNKMRERENELKQNLYRLRIRKQLMDEIDQAIADKVDAISNIAATLGEGTDEGEREQTRRKLAYIKMMVSYCKRISNFIMFSRQNNSLPADELVKALRETLQDSETVGIEYALVLGEEGEVEVEDALLIYEYIYRVIEKAMQYKRPVVFIRLSAWGTKIRLKLVLSAEGEQLKDQEFRFEHLMEYSPVGRGYVQESEEEYNSLELMLVPESENETLGEREEERDEQSVQSEK